MKNDIKKIQVTIAGKNYSLLSDQSEQHILHAAHMVDTTVQEILQKMQSPDELKGITLAALKLASSVLSLEGSLGQHTQNIQQCIKAIDTFLLHYQQRIGL